MMTVGYELMFGEKPNTKVHSPLDQGDHPELDTSELLDPNGGSAAVSIAYWVPAMGYFAWPL
jgi:hypothetical protein